MVLTALSCSVFSTVTPAAVAPTEITAASTALPVESIPEPAPIPTAALSTNVPTEQPPTAKAPTPEPTENLVDKTEPSSYGTVAEEYLAFLADKIGARWPGTDQERAAGDYVEF